MAAPDFLNSSVIPFYYHQTTGITDVNTIISDIRTAVVTNLSWTEPSTALFQSPSDSSGKFLDVLVTRISATNLEFRTRDYRGATLFTRRIQIDATASVNYFANKYGLTVESLRATPEICLSTLLDPSPSGLGDIDNRITGTGYRSNADSQDGGGASAGILFTFDNGNATNANRMMMTGRGFDNVDRGFINGAGTFTHTDWIIIINQSGSNRHTGRPYQMLVCDTSIAFGTDKIIPIDDAGNTGTFRVIGYASLVGMRVMSRKA